MPRVRFPLGAAVLAPPPGPPLPPPRGTPRRGALAAFGVAQVLAALGADRPPGHQQQLPVRARGRVRVDDPQVDSGDPGRVWPTPGRIGSDRHLRSHVGEQPAGLAHQRDRPDLIQPVRQVPGQPDPQRRAAPRHRQPQHPALHGERARIPADRHQRPLAAREPRRRIPGPPPARRAEPRITVAAQHRPGTGHVQLPESTRPGDGQLPAQVLIPDDRAVVPLPPPPVQVKHAAPHITTGTQQAEQAARLPAGNAQPAPRSPHRAVRYTTGGNPEGRFLPIRLPLPSPTDKTRQRHGQHLTHSRQPVPPTNGATHLTVPPT
jgi:hypothetical protein